MGRTLGFMRLEVCLFFIFFLCENKSGPIRLFLIPSLSEKKRIITKVSTPPERLDLPGKNVFSVAVRDSRH